MAIYTAATFGIPSGLNPVTPYIPTDSSGTALFLTDVTPTPETNILLDADLHTGLGTAINLTGGTTAGLTIQDAIVTANGITCPNLTDPDHEVLNSTNTVYNIMFTGDTNIGRSQWSGIWRFNGDRFIRRSGGGRYQLGFFNRSGLQASDWTLMIGENGLDINSFGVGPLIVHMNGLNARSVVQGLRFDGLALAQVNSFIPQFGFSPSNAASADSAQIHPDLAAEWGLNTRLIPGAATASVTDTDSSNPDSYVVYSAMDLDGILRAGRVGGAEFNDLANLRGTLQVSRNQVFWMVNPTWSDDVNDVLYLSAHNGGARPDSAAEAAEVRTFITHFPTWIDTATETAVRDVKVRYNSSTRFHPNMFNPTIVPASLTDNEGITTATVDLNADVTQDYSGFMIQDSRVYVNVTTESASQDPDGGIDTISIPTAKTFNARSFTHNVTYTGTVEPSIATGLTDIVEDTVRTTSLAPYLNGEMTAALAPLAVDTDYADMFAVLRKLWYETTTLITEFPVRGVGTSLIFDGPLQLVTNAGEISTNDIRLPVTSAAKVLTGDITTWHFSTHTNDWNGQAWPSGVTISGGFHDNIGAINDAATLLEGVTWIAENTPTIRIPTVLQTVSFAAAFGNVTGGFNIELAAADTVEITATAEQQAQILNRDTYTNQPMGSAGINFTRFVDIAEFDNQDNKQVNLFNADDIGAEWLVTMKYDAGGTIRLFSQNAELPTTSNNPELVDGHFRVTERQINTVSSAISFNDRMLAVSSSDISIPQVRYVDTIAAATIDVQFVTDPSVATSANDDALTIVSVSPRSEFHDGLRIVTQGFGSATAAQSKKFASDVRNTVQYAQWLADTFPTATQPRNGLDLSNQVGVQEFTADFSASSFFEVHGSWQFQPDENGPVSLQSYSLLAKGGAELDDLLLDALVVVPASTEATTVPINATLNTTVEIDYSRVNLEAESASRSAIDGTIMGMVTTTHNSTNYLLTNGVDEDGGGGYDRLIGIKPRAAVFNPDTNY